MNSGPKIFKEATVIAIHKGGTKSALKKYCPISLTSHIMETFKRVMRSHLVTYMENNNLINNSQYGFRIQLIDHYDYILTQLEQN